MVASIHHMLGEDKLRRSSEKSFGGLRLSVGLIIGNPSRAEARERLPQKISPLLLESEGVISFVGGIEPRKEEGEVVDFNRRRLIGIGIVKNASSKPHAVLIITLSGFRHVGKNKGAS
jgi:hypothetical protein